MIGGNKRDLSIHVAFGLPIGLLPGTSMTMTRLLISWLFCRSSFLWHGRTSAVWSFWSSLWCHWLTVSSSFQHFFIWCLWATFLILLSILISVVSRICSSYDCPNILLRIAWLVSSMSCTDLSSVSLALFSQRGPLLFSIYPCHISLHHSLFWCPMILFDYTGTCT